MANPCDKCSGRCCRYAAMEIDTPQTKSEFDEIRWYTAHRGVSVFVEDKRWYVNFATRCNFLTRDNQCEAYETRPKICRSHKATECEGPDGEYDFEIELRRPPEVDDYYESVVKPQKASRRRKQRKSRGGQ